MKSKIGGLGGEQIMLQRFTAILNCEVMVTHFLYLGLSVGGCVQLARTGILGLLT